MTEVGDHGAREIEAMSIDPALYALSEGPGRRGRTTPPAASGQALGYFLDLPLLRGDEPEYAGYFAASQTPWPGAIALFRSPADAGFTLKSIVPVPAITGATESILGDGPAGRLDKSSELLVRVDHGQLASTEMIQLLAGANSAAVRNPDGEWEVLQFLTATLVTSGVYRLSGLLRGQAGTESAMRPTVAAGAPFVLLGQAVAPIDLAPDEIGLTANWRFGPAGRDIGHASYAAAQHTFRGLGLRPLSPVHVRGRRNTDGDLLVSWVRRTRKGGDSWDTVDVPLAEDAERYEIDVLDGDTVKRTLSVSTPAAIYDAEQQTEDFGASPETISLRIHQVSAVWGRGAPRMAIV